MDGLALLCTLHADGPATLKRLRSAGCTSLTVLLERPLAEVARALDVAPAAARRLLREARLLAERVGPELDTEESPAPASATASPEPLALELAPMTSASTLDRSDRALLDRIVREGREARPDTDRASAATVPGLAPAPTALERAGLDLSAEGPWPTCAPESVRAASDCLSAPVRAAQAGAPDAQRGAPEWEPSAAAQAEPPPAAHESHVAEQDLAPLLALAGVEAAHARDLVRAGILTLEELARADALLLGRELHVTFAQAKRLCFLARRAAGPAPRPATPTATAVKTAQTAKAAPAAMSAPSATSTGVTPRAGAAPPATPAEPARAPAAEPMRTPAAAPECTPRPAWRIEPRTQPLAPAAEHGAAALAAPIAGPVPGSVAAPVAGSMPGEVAGAFAGARARFWEPRSGAHGDVARDDSEPQGVLVDPSEVDRPRRFSDVRRSAAQSNPGQVAGHGGPRPAALPPAAPPHDAPADRPHAGGTILGWNFEIPRPELTPAPEAARRTWRPLAADGAGAVDPGAVDARADETSAGPFA